MKKIIISLSAVSLFLLAGTASAQMGMMGNYYWQNGNTGNSGDPAVNVNLPQDSEINAVLQDIYKTQNIKSQGQIDCSQVTDAQFVKLGDAYMGVMLPNQSQHEAMDNMMGGEGSASLQQAHINMGRSYLGCWSNYNSGPIYMPTMGGPVSGNGYPSSSGNSYNYPMMWGGWGGYSPVGLIGTVLVLMLAVVGLVATIKGLITRRQK